MFGVSKVRFLFRTCMMKYPKGVDRYRLQNSVIDLYGPGINYALVDIYNRNPHFLAMKETQQTLEKEQQKKVQQKDSVEKNAQMLEKLRIKNQTYRQFFKQGFTAPRKGHKVLVMMVIGNVLFICKQYFDNTHPRMVPERAGFLEASKTPFFKLNPLSQGLDYQNDNIQKYDKRFWQAIQLAKQGKI